MSFPKPLIIIALTLFVSAYAQSPAPVSLPELCVGKPNGRYANPSNTNEWFSCLDGTYRGKGNCPSGTVFDEKANRCNPPQSTYLLIWSGPDSANCNDAVVVLDATPTSPTFGNVVAVTTTPTKGNEPHHVGLSADGAVLGVGGIQAFLKDQPDLYFFDVKDPKKPTFLKSVNPPQGGVPDSFVPIAAAAGGGFLVTLMGGADGTGSGRILKLNANYDVVTEFPTSNVPDKFNPHGIAVDATRKRIVTADYLDLSSTLFAKGAAPGAPAALRSTARVWSYEGNFENLAPVYTFDAKEKGQGFMTAALLGSTGVAVASSGTGILYGIDLNNPSDATTRPVHYVGPGSQSCVLSVFKSGTRVLVTSLGLDVIQLINTTDPWNWVVLQEHYLPEGSYPHAVSVAGSGTLAAVTTYYWNQEYSGKRIGNLNYPGSKQTIFFEIAGDGNSFWHRRTANFKTDVNYFLGNTSCGEWRPHGVAWKSVPYTPTVKPTKKSGARKHLF